MPKPLYRCEVCLHTYETEQEAIDCEAKGTSPAHFSVGETVYLREWGGSDSKPFVKREIVRVFSPSHSQANYELDEVVEVQRDESVGYFGSSYGRPALDSDFLVWGQYDPETNKRVGDKTVSAY